eukprot:TRINITY_DN23557_c0_g1_i1.p1 TRINITY_DN23557_c0_g1~~TRINITY_DN23557_c0_g1_i1.p1  ORF type:complete len:170 (-),score=36.88 TRINITY_DN23557_c0_g1_i1:461-970(-)
MANNIWTAAGDGNIERVEELMRTEGLSPTSADENGYTPIHAAASWGHLELLDKLLARDSGAVNVRDSDGDTALHHLAVSELSSRDLKQVMEVLIRHGADPSIRNKEDQTCLDSAALADDDENHPCFDCVDDGAAQDEAEVQNVEKTVDVTQTEFAKLLKSCIEERAARH